MRITDKHVFFWGGWPSNWYPSPIKVTIDKREINLYTSEQYFMLKKALFFNDTGIAEQIIKFGSAPKVAKALGRQVSNYDDELWNEKRYDIMVEALYHKFTQIQELKELLLNEDFKDKHFVEASPYDQIWGVGMMEDDPLIVDEKNWKGQNLLGKALDEVRNKIRKEEEK